MDPKTLKKLIDESFEENFIRLFNKGFEALISDRLSNVEDRLFNVEVGLSKLEAGQEEIKAQLNNLDRKVDRFNANHEERIIKLERTRKVI